MVKQLPRAVDELYQVFRRYPLSPKIDGCSHCVSAADQAALRDAPLRKLDARALRRFAFKALNTWGDADDLRHFLPRLLELSAVDNTLDLDITLAKVAAAGWCEWPIDEQQAIERYCEALWRYVLTRFPGARSAEGLLHALRTAFSDLSPFLTIWRETSTEPALCQLAELIGCVVRTTPSQADRQLVDWLTQPQTGKAIESGFFHASSPAVAQDLSDAVEELAFLCHQARVNTDSAPLLPPTVCGR